MTSSKVVGVTRDRQLDFPPEILATINPGDEYLIWQTEDTILLKKIAQPVSFEDLFKRIEAIGQDAEPLSEAEIGGIVKDVRHQRAPI